MKGAVSVIQLGLRTCARNLPRPVNETLTAGGLTASGNSKRSVSTLRISCSLQHQQHQQHQQQQQQTRQSWRQLHHNQRHQPAERESSRSFPLLRGFSDRYKGMHVNLEQMPTNCSAAYFSSILSDSLKTWLQDDRSSVWLSVPIERSHFIPEAAKFGFRFHHAENCVSVLCLWLRKDTPSLIQNFATHQVGVSGCVVDSRTNKVLVVKDKMQSHPLWKFPGGLADVGEDIDETAKREVWEETGIQTSFKGILAFRQQHDHPDAFGRSDLFYVCLMTPMTYDLDHCKVEIAVCQWMSIDELLTSNAISAVAKRSLQLVRYGLENGFEKVTIGAEDCKSIYKGKHMKLFTRTLEGDKEKFDLGDYPHDITTGDQFY